MDLMLIIKFLILTFVVSGVLIFVLKKVLFDSTQGAVNRLNRETEEVRVQQTELKEKIKQANEELEKRRKEADELVAKMKEQAEEEAAEAREKLVNKARQEGEEILLKAQNSKDDMEKAVEKRVRMDLAEYSAEILNAVISNKANEVLNTVLVGDFLAELENMDMSVLTVAVDEAELVTARTLTDQHKQKISEILDTKLGKKIQLKQTIDEKIISGAILKMGSLALDGSLKKLIIEEGTALKERIDRRM